MPRNIAPSKIGNGVISLLWQIPCHCIPDHDKFSSLSNKTVVAIFPIMFVYGDVVICSELGAIDPEKLLQYRATFICQYGLCCCIVWPSFLFDCTFRKNLANLREFFWANGLPPPPPGKKFPVRLWLETGLTRIQYNKNWETLLAYLIRTEVSCITGP